ncbi:hypothetical protein [uncultured Psychrosphaera sp.]|uniref:hypothetical protein n=1 Tax=uncultured Psychrosphaera sp. TaxID=1403522 RepID=UPI00262E4AF6|nr:hypothetical protein [uncultured Psychrosphaera sp.]
METEIIQKEIKTLLSKLGWSIPKLAEVIYVEKHEDDEAIDEAKAINSFTVALKKQLTRKTTNSMLLEEYLLIISNHSDFCKLGLTVPYYVKSKVLSETMESGMKDISKLITSICIE